jgi:6-phosphogluconolactonase (cycloisomerase 2 family)
VATALVVAVAGKAEALPLEVDGLGGARVVAISPGGENVYVAGSTDDALAVFNRDGATGSLSFVEVFFDNAVQVDGLDGPTSVVLSADGAYLYVASRLDDAVGVFARDAGTGRLTFVEAVFDGVAGVDGLAGAYGLALSPDGGHLYVGSEDDGAVAVFSRDSGTGVLTFVEAELDGVGGVTRLGGAHGVAVSPDGENVYVAASYDQAVVVFDRDPATGELSFIDFETDLFLAGAEFVLVSPDGANVYTSSWYTFGGGLITFTRDLGTGLLTLIDRITDRTAYNVLSIALTADGSHMYLPSRCCGNFMGSRLVVYSRDPATGLLTLIAEPIVSRRPSFMALSPDEKYVYVTRIDRSDVLVFSRDTTTGLLTLTESVADGPGGIPGVAATIAISPDGGNGYLSNFTDNEAVGVVTRAAATGELTPVEGQFVGAGDSGGARHVALSPDGAHAYVTNAAEDALQVYGRDTGTGALTPAETQRQGSLGVEGLGGVAASASSPDGLHVYAASSTDDAVVVFSRDAASGMLTFVAAYFDGTAGIQGLDGASAIAVSPDGAHVYVASFDGNALAAFVRDSGSGTLTFIGAHFDGVGGVDGLKQARSVAMTPDGAHLYVGSFLDDGIAVFSRDATTGALTFVEAQFDAPVGIDGLDGLTAVSVSPDGAHVYAVSLYDEAIVAFGRDTLAGTLTLVEVEFEGLGGVLGIDAPIDLAVSPDGAHVYVIDIIDGSVALFERNEATGEISFVSTLEPTFGDQLLAGRRLLIKNKVPDFPRFNKASWLAKDSGATRIRWER